MKEDINRIDISEFRKKGYLQEINRRFLHPLGLALEIEMDKNTGVEKLGGIWDYRDDDEGIYYDIKNSEDNSRVERFLNNKSFIDNEFETRVKKREEALGFNIEPIEPKKAKKRVVILTGAGISKESGIPTFRDAEESLWNNYRLEDVATAGALKKNPKLVLEFCNKLRADFKSCEPNKAHLDLVELEKYYHVDILTQNVDYLHESAGSSNVIHLHGSLTEARTNENPGDVYNTGYKDINVGDLGDDGNQLRPNIVLFGENLPNLEEAENIVKEADFFIIIGTSLEVYPVSGFHTLLRKGTPIYVVDPKKPGIIMNKYKAVHIKEVATIGVAQVVSKLIKEAKEDFEV